MENNIADELKKLAEELRKCAEEKPEELDPKRVLDFMLFYGR